MKFMQIDGWKYYSHAAIPTTPPHEPVNLEPINNGNIWKWGGYYVNSSLAYRMGLWV